MKKCICWCLSIIELKNARWNIENWHLYVLKVLISFFVNTDSFGDWLWSLHQVAEYKYKILSSSVSLTENLVISLAKLFVWHHVWCHRVVTVVSNFEQPVPTLDGLSIFRRATRFLWDIQLTIYRSLQRDKPQLPYWNPDSSQGPCAIVRRFR